METQDHKKITSSEHESHGGVQLCHKCGWPFPNPHPSAKLRRAHKRVCGKIEGYNKLSNSESDHPNFAGSDNDEPRTPSPKVEKAGIKELHSSAGMGLKSSRSDDDFFSDAVTEFSDSGFSPILDKTVGRELLHDLEDASLSKVDEKIADTSQSLHGLNQTTQGPRKPSEISDSIVLENKKSQPDITKSVSDIRTENVPVVLSSTNGLECDSSQVVSEFVSVSDNSTLDSEIGKPKELISSSLGIDIKEKGVETIDIKSDAASEVPQSENKLEIEPKLEDVEGKTSGPIALEAVAHETDKETADCHIEQEFQSKITNSNGDTSHTGTVVDVIVDQENSIEVESDSVKSLIGSSHGQSDEVFNLKEAGKEETHLLSVTESSPAVENLEDLIGDFKDYKVLKSSFSLDLEAAEEHRSVEGDKEVTDHENVSAPTGGEISSSVPENLPSAHSTVLAGTGNRTSSEALEDDSKKEAVSTAIYGEVGASIPENLPSVPVGTVDISSSEHSKVDLKEEGASTHTDRAVAISALENIPRALSSVCAGNVDNFPSETLEEDLSKKSIISPIDGEVGTSVPEDPPSSISSVPAGTTDITSSAASKDDLIKEDVSTLVDGEVGSSVPENPPSALTSVPAGAVDNFSSEALEDDHRKEGISTPIDGDACSYGYEDTHLPSEGGTLPAVENPEAMIGGFKDYKVFKSNFPVDLEAAEEHRSVEDDKEVTDHENVSAPTGGEISSSVPENLPSAHSTVLAGTGNRTSSEALENDPKMEAVSTAIYGEVCASVPENLPSVPVGTVDISSSEHSKGEGDLKEEGASTHTDRAVAISALENIPRALSSARAGNVDNFPSETLEEDLSKKSIISPIDGEVGTSVPEDPPSAISSVPAGTTDITSSAASKDDLIKEDVSTLVDGEVGSSVPENPPSALTSVPAGTVDNFSSEALEDDHRKEGISTPIDGDACSSGYEDTHLLSVGDTLPAVENPEAMIGGFKDYKVFKSNFPVDLEAAEEHRSVEDDKEVTDHENVSAPTGGEISSSVPENLPSAHSTVLAGTGNRTSSEALEDEPKKEAVSTAIYGEVGASVPENLPSVPVGTVDISSSEHSKGDLKEEGASTHTDRAVAISALEYIPRALSSVRAGNVDNFPSEALEDDLSRKSISSPIDGEVGTSVPEDPPSAVSSVPAGTADVTSSAASKDDLIKEDVSTLVDGEVGSSVPENPPSALTSVPAGTVDNFSSEALEDDHRKEGISTPIDGDACSSGCEDAHLLSATDTLPAVENPEAMIGGFKDYKVFKSNFPVDLGAAEEIISVEDDTKVTVPENLPSALLNVPAGNVDNSSSDIMEDFFKKDGVLIPIDGEVGSSGFSFTAYKDFGSSGAVAHPKAFGSETNNSQPPNKLEGSLPQSLDGKPLQNEDSEPNTREHSDSTPLESSASEQTWETTNLSGGESADNNGIDELVHGAVENGNVQAGDEFYMNLTTTHKHVEAIPETLEKSISLAGDPEAHKNSRTGFSSTDGNETTEVATEEKLQKNADSVHESTYLLTNSDSLDEAGGSSQVDIEMSRETEVPRSSSSPVMVSELKYEEPSLPSEKISETSGSKEKDSELLDKSSVINLRDAAVAAAVFNDYKDKVGTRDFSGQAADNLTVSSSRTDSLDANWGSVSVLSTQSDVMAAADVEVLSSRAAERIDGDSKKPQATAAECPPDNSDVFEAPSFMTLVESGAGVDKDAAASEIQTAQKDEQIKSEALQAGWFPSLTNVVNESEGRKKNEEIIAKVTNWSTGKQHSPLKNLLSEAHAETKANTKKVPAVVNEADETAPKNNGTTAVTTVSSILGSEIPSADTVKKEMEKEWNSPARYPIQIKKEKRKGKPYWVPFVCCSSVHQDV